MTTIRAGLVPNLFCHYNLRWFVSQGWPRGHPPLIVGNNRQVKRGESPFTKKINDDAFQLAHSATSAMRRHHVGPIEAGAAPTFSQPHQNRANNIPCIFRDEIVTVWTFEIRPDLSDHGSKRGSNTLAFTLMHPQFNPTLCNRLNIPFYRLFNLHHTSPSVHGR